MQRQPHTRANRSRLAMLGIAGAAVAALFVASRPSAGQLGPRPSAAAAPASGPASEPAAARSAIAADADAAEPPPPPVVTRVYDVRDLLVDVPNVIDGPDLLADDLGRGAGSRIAATLDAVFLAEADRRAQRPTGPMDCLRFLGSKLIDPRLRGEPRPGQTRAEAIDSLIRLVQETVAPDTWRETGGSVGAIKEFSGQFVVTQTAENHRVLADLLGQLREVRGINVRVRARWVLVPDRADLDGILHPSPPVGRMSAAAVGPASQPAAVDAARRRSPLLTATTEELTALPTALAHYDTETVCVNGQRVAVGSVRKRSTLANELDAAVGPGTSASAALPPLLSGLMLDVQPTLSEDRSTAMVSVVAQWKEARVDASVGTATFRTSAATRPTGRPSSGPADRETSAAAEATVPVDRRDGRTNEVRTALRMPLGRWVLVGGATLDPALPAAGDGGGKSPPRLYLFVEVTAD